MNTLKKYLSLVKFSHTIFALPFAMIGFCLGVIADKSLPDAGTRLYGEWRFAILFGLVIICMVTARSAAMAFNRWLDARYDALNPRTSIREIPLGVISRKNALTFVIINCVLFVAATWFINPMCFYLSPIALFVILFYSYTKRFTPLCHLVLGIGLSLAPIGAYLAVTGEFAITPVLFSLAVIFWVSGFDIIYALQDEDFDRAHQLYSIPAWLGKGKALRVSEVLHLFSAVCVLSAGFIGGFGIWYWLGMVVFSGMLLYQHSLVRPTDLSRVNIAFMTANGIASVVFAAFVITDLVIRK